MGWGTCLSHPYFVGSATIALTVILAVSIGKKEHESFLALQQVRADYSAREVSGSLDARLKSLERMAKRLASQASLDPRHWQTDAESIRQDFPDFQAIIFHDPQNHILWTSAASEFPVENSLARKWESFEDGVALDTLKGKSKIILTAPISRGGKSPATLQAVVEISTLFSHLNKLRFSQSEILVEDEVIFSNLDRDTSLKVKKWMREASANRAGIQFQVRTFPTLEAVQIGMGSIGWVVLFAGILISALFSWIAILVRRLEGKRLAALAASQKLECLLEFAPVGFLYADSEGKCVNVNRAWTEFTGISLEDSQDAGWMKFVHPEERSKVCGEWEMTRSGEVSFSCDFRICRADGEMVWLQGKAVTVRDEASRDVSIIGAFLDITRLKKLESALREKEQFLSAVVDHIPLALFCKDADRDFRFTLLNQKSEEIAGVSRDFLIGKTGHEYFPKEQAEFFLQKDLEAMSNGNSVKIEEEPVTRRDGSRVWVRTVKVPVKDAHGRPRYLLGISEDITEQREMQRQLEEQKLRLAYVDKMSALGEMAAGIAHEINNPLTIIGGNAAQLKRLLAKEELDRDKLSKAGGAIQSTVERIAKIIHGLQTFSRDGDGETFEDVKLEDVAEEALGFCRGRFGRRGIKVTVTGFEDLRPIRGRKVQLSQVLLNLLHNSFYAVKDQKDAFVSIVHEDLGEQITISVTDSGPRISDEVAEKLMQPFYTTKGVGAGTGLGLCISNNIVLAHGGRLYLDRQHENTRFVVELPKNSPREASIQGQA